MAFLAAITNTKVYQKKKTLLVMNTSNTEAWMSAVHLQQHPSKTILARTNC